MKKRSSKLLKHSFSHLWIEARLQENCHLEQKKNLQNLKDNKAVVVITGQQPCLLGGASLTLHKILHTFSICDWLNSHDIPAVPMFWSASEDHDLYEMLRVELWNPDFTPKMHKLSGIKRGYAAETFEEPKALHRDLSENLSPWLKEAFFSKPSHRFVDPFHHALQHCFGPYGLITIEPKDLQGQAQPFWDLFQQNHSALFQAYEMDDALLKKAGEPLQAARRRGLPLFALNNQTGERTPIDYRNGSFFRADKHSNRLIDLLTAEERISTGALLRPIFAQAQLPILVSVLGPAEYQYHRQTPHAFEAMQQPMPLLWPRLGGTYLPDQLVDFFELDRKNLVDYIQTSRQNWIEPDQSQQLPLKDIEDKLDQLHGIYSEQFTQNIGPLSKFKQDLNKSINRLKRGMHKAELTRQGWPRNKSQLCEDLLLPKGQPQERRLGWAQFVDSTAKLEQLKTIFSDPFDFSHRIYS